MSYNTTRFNHSWWTDQIKAGDAFREKYAREKSWPTWRKYYRGDWSSNILPVNFFFSILRALVPRVYFKNPAVSIQPTKPGLPIAIFSQILERIDNKLLRSMKVKKQIKKMIQDAFLCGVGIGKLGFGAQFSPSPVSSGVEAPLGRRWGKVEYKSGILPNMPWFSRTSPGNFTVPSGCEDIDDSMWVAHKVTRPLQDVKDDPRLGNTSKLVGTQYLTPRAESSIRVAKPIEMIDLFEIRDRKFGRVIVMSEGGGNEESKKPHYIGDDDLQTLGGYPLFPLIFNNDDEVFWGVPDAGIIEPQQLEMNEIRTQTMKHRRVALVKLLIGQNAMPLSEIEKMTNEEVLAAVQCTDVNQVKPMQVGDIPAALFVAGDQVRSDIRELVGFSRNQMGEMENKSERTTATEASIVQMASELRVDERRDIVADLLADLVTAQHEIIFNFWQKEQVIDVIGPGGIPFWITFVPEMLKGGAYEVSVDAESSMPESRRGRETKAIQVYQILKENPLIDPQNLTKYLLREMHGVQYDDLMRGVQPGAGLQRPLDIGEYGRVMSNASKIGLPSPRQGAAQ